MLLIDFAKRYRIRPAFEYLWYILIAAWFVWVCVCVCVCVCVYLDKALLPWVGMFVLCVWLLVYPCLWLSILFFIINVPNIILLLSLDHVLVSCTTFISLYCPFIKLLFFCICLWHLFLSALSLFPSVSFHAVLNVFFPHLVCCRLWLRHPLVWCTWNHSLSFSLSLWMNCGQRHATHSPSARFVVIVVVLLRILWESGGIFATKSKIGKPSMRFTIKPFHDWIVWSRDKFLFLFFTIAKNHTAFSVILSFHPVNTTNSILLYAYRKHAFVWP